jgi:hypothetical protein
VLFAALFLARPPVGWAPAGWKEQEAKVREKVRSSAVDLTPRQMLSQRLIIQKQAFQGKPGTPEPV